MNKILITGACGFIGSNLTEACLKSGFNVRAFDRYTPMNDHGWLEYSDIRDDIEIILGDIRDIDSVKKAMIGCDAVFHLAALIGIPYSYQSPIAYIRTNIEGTYNILESAKDFELDEIIVTSTSEVYGSAQYVPIDENHPMIGQSPYSASKIGADQLAISYFKSFKLPVKIIRPFNTFGPRQSARAVIPTVILQILNGNKNIRLGNLTPTRDLTFVSDTVDAFLQIHNSDDLFGEVINVGANKEISIQNLVDEIKSLMNSKIEIKTEKGRTRPVLSEVDRLKCDNSKILEHTQWRPKMNLIDGLTKTINWLKSNSHLYKPNLYNV